MTQPGSLEAPSAQVPDAGGVGDPLALQGGANDSWVGAAGGVTQDDVERLTQLLGQDPQGAALLAQATRHAQETVHQPFWKVISICPAGTDSNILGQTNRGVPLVLREERDLEESAFDILPDGTTDSAAADQYYRSRIDQERTKNGIPLEAPYHVLFFPDVLMIKAMSQAPGICLQKTLSLNDAVDTLYHEMVHYIAADWSRWVNIAQYEGEPDYELKQVLAQGDEVDAYTSQWSYEIRKGGKQAIPEQVAAYFADDGTFIPQDSNGNDNRQAVARLVLQGQIFAGGIGYHDLRFMSEYANELNYEDQSQVSLFNFLQEIEQNRQANLPYYRQQAEIARDRSRAQAVLAEDRRSIQRLPQEVLSCKARVDQLNSLVTQFNESQGQAHPLN